MKEIKSGTSWFDLALYTTGGLDQIMTFVNQNSSRITDEVPRFVSISTDLEREIIYNIVSTRSENEQLNEFNDSFNNSFN